MSPLKFPYIEYHLLSLLVMAISCKTYLLFVTAAFKIKKLLINEFLAFISINIDIHESPPLSFLINSLSSIR